MFGVYFEPLEVLFIVALVFLVWLHAHMNSRRVREQQYCVEEIARLKSQVVTMTQIIEILAEDKSQSNQELVVLVRDIVKQARLGLTISGADVSVGGDVVGRDRSDTF